MLAVAGTALLIGLPATLGRPGTLILGFILGAAGAAVIPALLSCTIQSRTPSPRDRSVARTMAGSGAIFAATAWWIYTREPPTGFAGFPVASLAAFAMGYGAFLLAATAGLIEEPTRPGVSAAKLLSLVVVLTTLPFALGAGMVFAGMIAAMGGRG